MAQSRERRNQRHRRPPPRATPRPSVDPRRRNLRRVVIAFLVLVGLAGILAVGSADGDPTGSPAGVYHDVGAVMQR